MKIQAIQSCLQNSCNSKAPSNSLSFGMSPCLNSPNDSFTHEKASHRSFKGTGEDVAGLIIHATEATGGTAVATIGGLALEGGVAIVAAPIVPVAMVVGGLLIGLYGVIKAFD